jgi:hypothetical protein
MSEPTVLWQANSPVQRAFLACTARTALMGGGVGSGKTSALLVAGALQCANPKSRAIIFRRDYPSLRQIIGASYALFLPLGATYNKSEHIWQFRSGGTLAFGHLEDETATFQHAGQEYSFLGFDELTQLPGDTVDSRGQPISSAFAFMQSRLRAAVDSGLRLEVRCTATPGGRGHGWVKSYFRIGDSGESCEHVDAVTGFRRCYFKATVFDNPALSDSDYVRQLLDLPEAKKKALLYGDWSSYEGQVYSEYSYDRHTCEPIDPATIPESWPVWRGADDGYSAPAAIIWLAYDKIHDRVFVVREVYQSGLTPETMAEAVLAMDGEFGRGRLRGIIDSASFSDCGLGTEGGDGGRGGAMNKLGCRWEPSAKGAGSRVAGVSAVHQRLALKADGRPGLIIGRNCKHLIRTLPQMVYDKKNPEDIDPGCEEHAIKALMYGLTRKVFQPARRIEMGGI